MDTKNHASTQATSPVLTHVSDGVVTVTLNRPEAMNAVNRELSDAIATVMQRADEDSEISSVIITSNHPKAFCAGADLEQVAHGTSLYDEEGPLAPWGLAGSTARTPSVPVIAAVEGAALGGGFEIALAADILIASPTASFGLPEVQVGLIAGAGGAVRLPRQLPRKVALDLLLTGERLSAERAHGLGLVSRLVEPGEAQSAATEVALRISANAPLAVRATKATALDLVEGVERGDLSRWKRSSAEFASVLTSQDAQEGASAFKDRRPPRWSGR